jgi:sphinganine C4-monooxygenase
MAVNASVAFDLPPLPTYTLTTRENLTPLPDNILSLILPIVAYWGLSMIYHYLDVNEYFVEYRLHTPAEVAKRNKVSRWEVIRDVLIQQLIQTVAGLAFLMFDAEETVGREGYDVAVWAQRLRIAQKAIPSLLALVGVDAIGLASSVSRNGHTMLAGALAGGSYPGVTQSMVLNTGAEVVVPASTEWELALASFIYWYFVPALQFMLAVSIVDTWQYFLHRAMHLNRWLYGMCQLCYDFR